MMRAPLTTLSFSTVFVITCLATAPRAAVEPWRVEVVRQPPRAVSGDWTADIRRGWAGDDGQPRMQFNLRTEAGESQWGFGIRAQELQGLPPAAFSGAAGDVRFSWALEAGTFSFAGSFDSGRGSGRYTFEPSSTFLSAMGTLGYETLSGEDALRLAVIGVTTAYVRELGQDGYRDLPLEQLTRMRIHRVMPEFIRELKALGYPAPGAEQLVKMRIHRVEPEFIRGLRTRGYGGLATEDLIKVRIHKVNLEDIDQYKALGFGGLGTEELVRFRIHQVTPAFVREMREVGFASVTEEQLVRMRIHKVDAQFVRDARADGYAMTTPADAVDLAIRGPRYTRARKRK